MIVDLRIDTKNLHSKEIVPCTSYNLLDILDPLVDIVGEGGYTIV